MSVLATTMHATLVPSTPSAPTLSPLGSPSEHPMYAAAGIVVTEMATPTAAPAGGLVGQHPGHPGGQGDEHAARLDRRQRWPEHRVGELEVVVDAPRIRNMTVAAAAENTATPSPTTSVERGAAGERPASLDEPDGGGGDRQEVGAERHRPDDQDRRPVEHPDAGDDTRRGHEQQVDQRRPGVLAGSPGDLGPDRRVATGGAMPADAAPNRAARWFVARHSTTSSGASPHPRRTSSTRSATSASTSPVTWTIPPAVRPPMTTWRTPATPESWEPTFSACSFGA